MGEALITRRGGGDLQFTLVERVIRPGDAGGGTRTLDPTKNYLATAVYSGSNTDGHTGAILHGKFIRLGGPNNPSSGTNGGNIDYDENTHVLTCARGNNSGSSITSAYTYIYTID